MALVGILVNDVSSNDLAMLISYHPHRLHKLKTVTHQVHNLGGHLVMRFLNCGYEQPITTLSCLLLN